MGHGAHEMQAGREWNGSSVVLFVLCMGIHFLDHNFSSEVYGIHFLWYNFISFTLN